MNEIKLFANDWKLLHKAKQNIFQLTFIIFQCHILMIDKLGEPVVKVWEGNKCFGIVSKSPFDLKFFVKLSIKIFFLQIINFITSWSPLWMSFLLSLSSCDFEDCFLVSSSWLLTSKIDSREMWINVISRFFRNVTTKRCAFMQFDKFLTCWRRGFVQLNLIHWFFETTNSYYFRSSLLICLRFMLLSRPLLEPDLHATADCMRNSRRNIVVSKAFSRCVNFLNKLFKGKCRPYNCRAVLSFYVTRSSLKSCKTFCWWWITKC